MSGAPPPASLPGLRQCLGGWLTLALLLLLVLVPASPVRAAPSAAAASLPRLFDQALAASRAGDFPTALALWDQVLELAPQDAAAWSNRGNVRLALGDAEAAIADQGRAMQLDPVNPDPHLNRGTAEEALQRWDAAEADYRWILERDAAAGRPADASALYNLGNVQGSRGDWASARASFLAAADARPGFAMARSSAALAALQLGDPEAAEAELRRLIRRHPLFADARAGLTAVLWRRGASGEAESHWASASGLDPRYRQPDWLLEIRRWPPQPVAALSDFLSLGGTGPRTTPAPPPPPPR
ncbi:MAG: hypothetical protein RLZZ124_990 [Cyanobacteriota bacterium]